MIKNTVVFMLAIDIFLINGCATFAGYDKLTRDGYENSKYEKAVVIYGVNWGRQWGCAGFDNAQLQNLTFSRIDSGKLVGEDIVLNSPAKLFSENVSEPYAIIINPGKYVLTAFDIKISKSSMGVNHIKGKSDGTFEVNPGEIVYIGDFGIDCSDNKPTPWRYYIRKDDFDSYVAGFKKKHKFIGNKQVIYRLFQTNELGQ